MRITQFEADIIVDSVQKFDPEAEVYLFGSRVDDSKRGGDIDVLVKSDLLTEQAAYPIKEEILRHLEEQKIDLVITGKSRMSAFAAMVYSKGVARLCRRKS